MKSATRVGLFILGVVLFTVATYRWHRPASLPLEHHADRHRLAAGDMIGNHVVVDPNKGTVADPRDVVIFRRAGRTHVVPRCRPYSERERARLDAQCPKDCGCTAPLSRCKRGDMAGGILIESGFYPEERWSLPPFSLPVRRVRDGRCSCPMQATACVVLMRLEALDARVRRSERAAVEIYFDDPNAWDASSVTPIDQPWIADDVCEGR